MTKDSVSRYLGVTVIGLLLPIFLMFGCGSTSQPERPASEVPMVEQLPKSKAESPPSEMTAVAEETVLAEVDEKNNIFFSLGSSTINQREREKLRYIANNLKNDKKLRVMVTGHANGNGSSSFNLAVADSRVESVSKILRKVGFTTQQIQKRVIGGEKISGACQSVECRRNMRRVELNIFSVM